MTAGLLPLDTVPAAPSWLTHAEAVRRFKELAPIMVRCSLLSIANLDLLGSYCMLPLRKRARDARRVLEIADQLQEATIANCAALRAAARKDLEAVRAELARLQGRT